jgi:hypothetical protein
MLEPEKRDPRAPGDTRMYLYFDYSPLGALSEGGEDVSNFNNLPIWAKVEVRFPPIGAFQARRQS